MKIRIREHLRRLRPLTPAQLTHRRRVRQLRTGHQLHALTGAAVLAGGGTQLAAFGTNGLEEFLKGDALQVGILIAGLVVIFSAKKKDAPGALVVGGIGLFGLAIMGLSGKGFDIGEFLSGWIWH
ncbi:hypothetical protein [Streptomyces sp. Ac-502]|uniref:hypothetical protein n=1 Tax=Streptomyces sp. Ac-502 TaxID=3342801 RepID=UPI0038626B19